MSTFVAILVSVKAQSNSDTAEWWGDHHGEFGLNTVGLGAVAPSSVNPTVEYFYDHLDQKDVSNKMPVSMRKLTKPHLLGSDGHGLPPRHKAHLLGSDGDGLPPAYLSQYDGEDNDKPQLLGANGHGLPPRHKAQLLGSDGHGLPPRHKAQLLGSDGHGRPPAFYSQPTVVPTVNPTVEYFYDHLDQNDGQQQVIPADQELQKLGAGGHGQQTIPAIQLIPAHNLGANGHGLPPRHKAHLLGSDGHGLPPAYLSRTEGEDNDKPQLLGANGHGLPPRHKVQLLGANGHGLPPAQFVGKDGRVHHVMRAYEVQAPDHEAHLLGANGHGLPRQRLTSKVAEGEDEEAMMLPFINLLPSTGVSGGQGVVKKAENNGDDIDDEGPEGSMGDQQQQLMVGGVWRRLRGSFVE